MNCEKMFEIMPELLNKTLGKEEEKQAFEHLLECEECRRELAFWTKIADAQPSYEKEFSGERSEKVFESLKDKEATLFGVTKQAVKVYFKVIETLLNIKV